MRGVFFTIIFIATVWPSVLQSQNQEHTLSSVTFSDIEELEDTESLGEPKRTDIKTKSFDKIEGATAGYHLIANSFSKNKFRKRFQKAMVKKGFDAHSIQSPDGDLNYVCIQHYFNWEEAVAAFDSQIDGKYHKPLWALIVQKDENQQIGTTEKSNKYAGQSKLLKRANTYFDAMRYAEAAKYYEMALNNEAATKEVLQRAGDAHYFNSNMEKAYHWYNKLYEAQKDDMSAENLFKYSHALKGNGNYNRAKRIMRLYRKKIKTSAIESKELQRTREAILDEILTAEKNAQIKNLQVNSKYSDFSPMYYGADQLVFASAKDTGYINTRRYKWNNQPYLDLYVSKINEATKSLGSSKKLSKTINTQYHEASVAFTPDGQTMYFTRNNTKGKKVIFGKKDVNHLKIYRSRLIDGQWTEGEELPFNSDDFSTGHPALSPDGSKLYFASDRPGSIGKTDIFFVNIDGKGNYSEPISLGPEINTPGREMFPFVNDKKLYFSSDGHIGLGGLDIFEAPYSETGFEQAKNLGQPINSRLDDFSYIVREEDQEGYFASNRRGGKGDDDIYSFKRLVPEEVEDNLNAITGVVTELITGDTMPNALVQLLDENNRKLMEVVADDSGTFLFEDLDGKTNYILKVNKNEFLEEEKVVSTLDNQTVTADIAMKRMKEMIVVEGGIKKLKTDMILFDFDQSYIREDASRELDKLVEVMTTYEDMVIKIESHTDAIGANAYNKYLSDKRAKSTRDYLIAQGIDASRIASAIGYGEEKPLNNCVDGIRCTKEKHRLNRRSEFIIVSM